MTGRLTIWFFIVSLVRVTVSVNDCCPGNVSISSNQKCDDDGGEVQVNCTTGNIYLFHRTDEIEHQISVNETTGNLLFGDEEFESTKYCFNSMILNDTYQDIILICDEEEEIPSILPIIIFAALEIITIALLCIIIAVYLALSELRDLQGKCILHFLINYCLLFVITNTLHYNNTLSCVIKAYSFYFFSFCAWSWLCVSSFNIWKASIIKNAEDSRTYITYLFYGYGFPIFLLILLLLIQLIPGSHLKPNFNNNNCWFEDYVSRWWYYHLPVAVLLLANIFFLVDASRCLRRTHHSRINIHRIKALRARCWLYSKLSIIVGSTWIFEILCNEFFPSFGVLILATDILNCLQGFLIFITLIAFRNKVLKAVAKAKPCGMNCFPNAWLTVVDMESEEENRNRYHYVNETEFLEIPLKTLNSNI